MNLRRNKQISGGTFIWGRD